MSIGKEILATDYDSFFSAKIDQLKKEGNYRYFLDVNKSAQHFPKFYYEDERGNKKSAINWCSNDYLCMSVNEEVISKLSFTAHKSGVGSSGTRNISGTTIYHRELENTLADLHKKESALLFNGAYLANLYLMAVAMRCAVLEFVCEQDTAPLRVVANANFDAAQNRKQRRFKSILKQDGYVVALFSQGAHRIQERLLAFFFAQVGDDFINVWKAGKNFSRTRWRKQSDVRVRKRYTQPMQRGDRHHRIAEPVGATH